MRAAKCLTAKLMLPALVAAGLAGCRLPARELPYVLTHQIASVPTEGMSPAIKPGDHVAIMVGYYDGHPVERFDIVARYPLLCPIPEIAENIRERVAPEAGGRKTMVVVDDLEVVGDEGL